MLDRPDGGGASQVRQRRCPSFPSPSPATWQAGLLAKPRCMVRRRCAVGYCTELAKSILHKTYPESGGGLPGGKGMVLWQVERATLEVWEQVPFASLSPPNQMPRGCLRRKGNARATRGRTHSGFFAQSRKQAGLEPLTHIFLAVDELMQASAMQQSTQGGSSFSEIPQFTLDLLGPLRSSLPYDGVGEHDASPLDPVQ